jgi:release factor glutamine methyltransferase
MPEDASAQALTVKEVLRQATVDLNRAGIEGAGNDARRLLSAALGLSGAQILARPERSLSRAEVDGFKCFIARRVAREPVSRILGEREFYGRSFAISPATLDPRADSETLIDATLELVIHEGWQTRPLRILDVGAGSGCLLLTLLAELPGAVGVGTDLSLEALKTARANALRLGLEGRAHFLAGDLLEAVRGTFDILISNPPYVRSSQIAQLEPEVREHDPIAALDGGVDGFSCLRRLIAHADGVVPAGWVVFEAGPGQADRVIKLLAARGLRTVRVHRDVAGRRRCVAARTRN